MISDRNITLRPVTDQDRDFLLLVYASAREEEMARVPWTSEQKSAFLQMQYTAQSQHYRAEYPAASQEIICINSAPAGRLYLDRGQDKLHILDITILPQFRNSRVGSMVLRGVMDEARRSGKPVTIYVESFNRSQQLFERLGFERAGEEGFNLLLRWTADAAIR